MGVDMDRLDKLEAKLRELELERDSLIERVAVLEDALQSCLSRARY